MSKCKAVLDGNKVRTIQVRIKQQPAAMTGTPESKSLGKPASPTTQLSGGK